MRCISNSKTGWVGLMAFGLLVLSQLSHADQPAGVSWKILEAASSGRLSKGPTKGGDTKLKVELKRDKNQTTRLLVIFRNCGEDPAIVGQPMQNLESFILGKDSSPIYVTNWVNPGPRWRLCPKSDAILLSDKAQTIELELDFLRSVSVNEGMSPKLDMDVFQVSTNDLSLFQTVAELARNFRNKPADGKVPLSVHYRLLNDTWSLGSYDVVYGSPANGGKGTSDYVNLAASLPVLPEAYTRKIDIPAVTTYDYNRSVKTAMDNAVARGSSNEGDQFCYPETTPISTTPIGWALSAGVSHAISGRFSTKWTSDHSLHSGFGFIAAVYKATTGTLLGSAWVQANGRWTVNIPNSAGFSTGQQIQVRYLSNNDYFAPQNQAEKTYWWYDPLWTVNNPEFNVGHRYADTDGGTYNGVGELVDNAMTMWSRLYWDAEINPVDTTPIKFYFPNTWENCGGDSPWSCASGNQLWLIAAHGVLGDVVNHEMAHVLNNKFWSNKRPAGSGGAHNLNQCYPTRLGMALREGFANFIAAWVGYPNRNVADGGFTASRWNLGWDAEQRTAPPNCTNGWQNEVWVARTFWDMHDTRADGNDILWFNHPGAVISLYLGNGIANNGDARDMRFYETIYRNAASSGHQDFITDIFEQNRH